MAKPAKPSEKKPERLHHKVRNAFHYFAVKTSEAVGTAWSFILAVTVILIWGVTGPMFGFSDTWQLIINTGTTIVTFLMVFLIQNMQNRDAKAIHLKLDELIRAQKGARNELVDLEKLSEEELEALEKQFESIRKRANGHVSRSARSIEEKLEAELESRSR
jgi:low affinity Fe/Cu permease